MKPTAPIRETVTRKCRICGDKIEDASRTATKICYSCWLDRQIPRPQNYAFREQYQKAKITPFHPVNNATRRPKTGCAFLDEKRFFVEEMAYNVIEALELRWREQQQGLDDREYWHPKVYS